jgi:hypothetical protein
MKTALLVAAFFLAGAAQAQTVWRCGPDGRSYSATPCPEGRVVAVADPRSAEEVTAGRDVAARESALARNLTLQRTEREALARRMVMQSTAAPPTTEKIRPTAAAKKPSKRQRQQQHREAELTPSRTATGGTSSAVAPASRRKTG